MHILILSQRVPFPPNKGEKLRTYHQIEHLISGGHTVSVCTPSNGKDDIDAIKQLGSKLGLTVIHEALGHSLPRLVTGLLLFKTLSVSNFYSRRLKARLDEFLDSSHIDAILCTSSSMAEYVFRSRSLVTGKNLANAPILLMDFMDLDSDKWKQYSRHSSIPMKWVYSRESYLLSRYEHRIQQDFNHCFFISQNEVDLFHQNISKADNVHVLGNGIDSGAFYPPDKLPENQAPVLIFTGVMDYMPNVEAVHWFIDNAWSLIQNRCPDARFIIAGMNPIDSIKRLSDMRGIVVTGFVDEILPYYHKADYFVAPFTIARGVQNKVLQAFACGLPVITTHMGAEGILCEDDRNVIFADTGEKYLKAIVKLESDLAYRQGIIDSALKLIIDHYSWRGQLKPLDKILGQPD